jgi:hypothetical protein
MKVIRPILLVLIMIACTKENDDFRSVGTIMGIDGTMCGCCGGWVIIIQDTKYLIDSLPEYSDPDLSKETFPITVKLDWQLLSGCSNFNRISVQRIKKI